MFVQCGVAGARQRRFEQSEVWDLASYVLKEKTLDLRVESKGIIARHVNELSVRQTSYLPQAIQDAAILRSDTSSGVQHARPELDGSEDDNSGFDRRDDEITLAKLGGVERLLIEGDRQAVALPPDLHRCHASTSGLTVNTERTVDEQSQYALAAAG